MGALFGLPGTVIDRLAFHAVVRGFANPPLFVSGHGRHDSPWQLQTFGAGTRPDSRQAPVVVSLGDDREGFFQTSPPSPIDLAVVLTDIHRLGAAKAATAVVLAWDAPDPIGLMALDKALGRFDSLVMAAPLSRGAVSEPMPRAFRDASVAVSSVHGDVADLPVVNRIPLPGIILSGKNALAGFQSLESEPAGKLEPLLARWEDRVVFAFPLLCVLQRLNLQVTDLDIRPGEAIRLGKTGPVVPINRFGRLPVELQTIAPFVEIPAEEVVDGANGLLPHDAPTPVVLRDDRNAAEPATRQFSKSLPALIAALSSNHTLAPTHDYNRLPTRAELALLLLVALVLTASCVLPPFSRNIVFLTITAVCLGAQWVAAGTANLWLPGLPALAAIAVGWALSGIIALRLGEKIGKTGMPTSPPWPGHVARSLESSSELPSKEESAAPPKPALKPKVPRKSPAKKTQPVEPAESAPLADIVHADEASGEMIKAAGSMPAPLPEPAPLVEAAPVAETVSSGDENSETFEAAGNMPAPQPAPPTLTIPPKKTRGSGKKRRR